MVKPLAQVDNLFSFPVVFDYEIKVGQSVTVVADVPDRMIGHRLPRDPVVVYSYLMIKVVREREDVKRYLVHQKRIGYRHKILPTVAGCFINQFGTAFAEVKTAHFNHAVDAVESNRDFVVEAGAGNTPDHNPALVAQLSAFRSDFRSYLAGFAFVVNFAFNHFRQQRFVLAAGSHHRHSGKNDSCCRCKP